MTVIRMNPVLGEVPRLNAERLPEQAAAFARDCDFAYSDIRALAVLDSYQVLQEAPHSFHLDENGEVHTFHDSAMSVIASPVADELYDRFYCCSPETGLRVKSGIDGELYRVGVPVPKWSEDKPFVTVLDSIGPVALGVTFLASVWWEDAAGTRSNVTLSTVRSLSAYTGKKEDFDHETAAEFVIVPVGGVWPDVAGDLTLCASLTGMQNFSVGIPRPIGSIISSSSIRVATGEPLKIFGTGDVTGTVRMETLTGASGVTREVVLFSVTVGIVDERAYLVTLVNQWGEESAPSRAVSVALSEEEDAQLVFNLDHLQLPDGYVGISTLRIYRSAITSGSLTDYFYLDEVPLSDFDEGTFLYTDDVSESDAADDVAILSTEDYLPAPDGLQGVGVHPSGFVFAWKGAELWVSEPYLPYAWKPGNTLVLNADIVGAKVHSGSVFCATKAYPELINGSDPSGLLPMRLSNPQAGVGAAAIADAGNLVFASPDGLVQVAGADAQLMSNHFTRAVWRERYGDYLGQLSLEVYDGALYGVFQDIDGFVIRLDESKALCRSSLRGKQVQYHPEQDRLYVLGDGELRVVGQKRGTAQCQTKPFRLLKPEHFSVLSITGYGVIGIAVFADGREVLRTDNALTGGDSALWRLPGGFRAAVYRVSFTLSDDAFLTDCYLASSVRRLRNAKN